MDQTQLQQKIAEYYVKLPKEAQTVFANMKWMEDLKRISAKYNLNEEQIATLATETTLVLLGIIHLNEYEKIIVSEFKISKESTDKIIAEIYISILKAVQPHLIKAFDTNAKFLAEEKIKNAKWDDNIKFILSGGNYSYFMEKPESSSNFADTIRAIIPNNPIKADDIKSKFVI